VRLLFDECIEVGLAQVLRGAGHDVVFVQDIEPGADDGWVMALATAQDRLLVTMDKDFGELALRRLLPVPGVLLVRIAPEQRHQIG
jgi:predicted nuclease of predicted toxin-antitoxin system